MGLTRRILESARSGLSTLTSLVIVDDEELSQVDAAALEAELKARRAARERIPRKPEDNPAARHAGGSPVARAQRKRAADERGAKVRQEKHARESRERAAADEAFRRMKAQGGTAPPPPRSGGPSSGRAPRPGSNEAQLAEWYRVLDLQPGADFAAVKSAYRTMMRKYHPDLFTGDPRKQKAANELSLRVTTAYNNLRKALEDK